MERSRAGRWIRAGIAVALVLASAFLRGPTASAAAFDRSAVVLRDGNPTLVVDGKPFFFYGAAFFYERIPASRWRASMLALRALGFNTLDLYIPWNWHETADDDFDFDGRTNARRNLRGVLALARELDFKLIVRPGPVIRNEWRNGGYPAWLLTRPEYGMPLHDVLEGRYPATATLQNANSDDAAAQWMDNATHMRYAGRWLRTALQEFVPYADRVIAVQLDDDQGAYIDNQTWPAPHLQRYLRTLEAIVRETVGPQLPVFINTYEMKVTAASPVWAMGNWYQSDAYAIGEHDRAALEFSTGLLQTQPRMPVAMSEFQAGWLAPPEDPQPRPADPTNTTLALHTLLGLGARGVIDFPAQDTVNPAGWEAPFANADYDWGAALGVDLTPSDRYAPTARFGAIVRAHGTELAAARRWADGAIAYLTSAYDAARQTNADVFAIVARTEDAQRDCRLRHLVCDLVDLRYATEADLRRYPFLIVPRAVDGPFLPAVRERLARYTRAGGRVLAQPPAVVSPHNGGTADATILLGPNGSAFFDLVNYDAVPRAVPRTSIALLGGRTWMVGPLRVPPRDSVLLRFPAAGTAMSDASPAPLPTPYPRNSSETASIGGPRLIEDDRAEDGYPRVTVRNRLISMTLAPNAGGRAFSFTGTAGNCSTVNAITSVGALRDDAAMQPPLSTTDRIGKYTRSFPAGTFNRDYAVVRRSAAADAVTVGLRYTAPDVVPAGATFERTITIDAREPAIDVTGNVRFAPGPDALQQRALRYDSFDARDAVVLDERANGGVGFFYPHHGCVATVGWPPADVEDAQLISERTSIVLRLRFAPGATRTRYALDAAATLDDARAVLRNERTGGRP
jgi:hypothetical protein